MPIRIKNMLTKQTIPVSTGQPVLIVADNPDRFELVVQNRTNGNILLGTTTALTQSPNNGIVLATGQGITMPPADAIYAIAESDTSPATGIVQITENIYSIN